MLKEITALRFGLRKIDNYIMSNNSQPYHLLASIQNPAFLLLFQYRNKHDIPYNDTIIGFLIILITVVLLWMSPVHRF